jgi:hypothetical protein
MDRISDVGALQLGDEPTAAARYAGQFVTVGADGIEPPTADV